MGSFIEKQKQHFPEYKDIESKTEYHALTRGLIINEIVRRIDPKVWWTKQLCTIMYMPHLSFDSTWVRYIDLFFLHSKIWS